MDPRGRTFGGRYEPTSLIATGGMGQVWRARDTRLGRDVAVKVLRSEFTGDADFLARFRAEAQHTARLVHPNIATLFDYGEVLPDESEDGEHLAYLVMELVDGEALSALLARERRLGPERTLDVLQQAAAGLAAAHAIGVVHRDVKPGNLLVARDGQVKITDFGAAWSASSVPLTQTGQVIGTAQYLSPEQAQGVRANAASDVYSLGVVAYECLAGRRAFTGDNSVQIALKQIREVPEPLPDDVPEPLRQLVDRAMAKDPAQRFPDGAAFRAAIEDIRAGRALAAPPAPGPTGALPVEAAVASPGTQVLPAHTGGIAAGAGDDDEPPARSRLLVPLVALLAVAAIVFGMVRTFGDPGTEASSTSATPTATTATPTTEPPLVPVAASSLVGRPVGEVQAELTGLGLAVTLRPLQTTDVPDGQVIAVDPVGELAPGSPVTVTHAVAPPPAPAPVPVPETATQVEQPARDGGDDGDDEDSDENRNGNGNGKAKGRDKQDD